MTEQTMERAADVAVERPAGVSQATAIEQSRAVAEVQAAVVVAQQCPRNVSRAVASIRDACRQKALAERAFFRYARSGSQISGASIHLAREVARCWGNVQYGIAELSRDHDLRQSEMIAFAWDVETNTRTSNTFIVPWSRDTRQGARALVDLRDVYENNANMGARRVREAIFAVVPAWFSELAQDVADETLTKAEPDKPFEVVVADMVRAYADEHGVSVDQLEEKVGRPSARWTPHDVAQLRVVFMSLRRQEVSREDEFPTPRVTADEIQSGGEAR